MTMPGSETCLEELVSNVVGNILQEGCMAKMIFMSDVIHTEEAFFPYWACILYAFKCINLSMSALKTIVFLLSTVLFDRQSPDSQSSKDCFTYIGDSTIHFSSFKILHGCLQGTWPCAMIYHPRKRCVLNSSQGIL